MASRIVPDVSQTNAAPATSTEGVGQLIDGQAPLVAIWLTPVLATFYKAYGLFPELFVAPVAHTVSKTRVVAVQLELGERLLLDAEQRYKARPELPRGMACAFGALIARLRQEIVAAKGLWEDPGKDEAVRRQQDEFARFKVGDRVRYLSPWIDDENNGEVRTIVAPYGVFKVSDEDGKYLAADGVSRVSYKTGYGVRSSDGDWFFCEPQVLQTMDYRPGYLRLVWSNPNPN
jgi:hypothetical protein